MWLAPYINSNSYYNAVAAGSNQPNELAIVFERQVCISYIKFWNYSKSPMRGVKDFEVTLDDILLFKGTMRPVITVDNWSCSVLFSGDP